MRRGLMAWNEQELPASALAARLVRLRAAMSKHGLDALILYTCFPRPSAVAWVTAFTPYWSDALLFVPREGEPVFATALSRRVASWIETQKPVAELVCTPKPGAEIGKRIAADAQTKKVGILEIDAFPNGIYDDLAAAAPNVTFVDGAAAFSEVRRVVDDAERRLIAKANAIAAAALRAIDPAQQHTAGAAVGAAEQAARLEGAEEAYIHIAPDLAMSTNFARLSGDAPLGTRFAVRASVAYKGIWVRRVQTFGDNLGEGEAWLAQALAALKPDRPIGAQLAGVQHFLAEGCRGSYPLEAVASSEADATAAEGALLVVTVKRDMEGAPWLGGAPVIVQATGSGL